MSSELRVNKLTSRSGVGTVTFNDSGLIITGIATAATLDITGNATIAGVLSYDDVTNVDSVGIITARSDLSIADKIIHTGDTNTAIRFPAADTITAETSGSERMRIDSSGNVQIGTLTSNTYKLHLSTAGSNSVYQQFSNGDTGTSGTDGFLVGIAADKSALLYQQEASPVRIFTNSAERMRIDSSGKIGIGGLTNPGDYHANANSLVSSGGITLANTTMGSIYFADSASGTGEYVGQLNYDHTTDSMQFGVNVGEKMRIDSSGRLLVGGSSSSNLIRLGQKFAVSTTSDYGGGSFTGFNGTTAGEGPIIDIQRSRGTTTVGTAVATNDRLGSIVFRGDDGTDFADAAYILGEVDGTPSGGFVPGRFTFYTGTSSAAPTERMRIDSSGRVGFGVTTMAGGSSSVTIIRNSALRWADSDGTQRADIYGDSSSNIVFRNGTGSTEQMRIKSTGNVLVGTNTDWFSRRFVAEYTDSAAAFINSNVNSPPISVVNTASSGTNVFVVFYTDSRSSPQSRGSIDYNRSAGQVRYNVTSDKRLKSNIQPAQSATDLLSSIQVRSYEWTETGHQIAHGFIAQELNEIMPDAVKVGDSDEQVSDAWSVDHSKMVPMLTKALQEAIAKIETLEAKVASLEG